MNKAFDISRRRLLLSLPALVMAPREFVQTANPPIRARAINHVTLDVSDVKRSVDFYQGLFGMPVINRQGTTSAGLQIGNGPQHLGLTSAGSNAPKINHLCLAVDNFNVDRLKAILARRGITESEAAEPMRMRVRMRGPEAGGGKEGTPEFYFRDPDGIVIQLQDPRYCGGAGPLGNICPRPEPSPKRGLIALRNWSHCTNSGSDRARSNKVYQELFGFRIQAYQGRGNPVFGFGDAGQFLAFGAGGGQGAAGAAHPGTSLPFCMTMANFHTQKGLNTLASDSPTPGGESKD